MYLILEKLDNLIIGFIIIIIFFIAKTFLDVLVLTILTKFYIRNFKE